MFKLNDRLKAYKRHCKNHLERCRIQYWRNKSMSNILPGREEEVVGPLVEERETACLRCDIKTSLMDFLPALFLISSLGENPIRLIHPQEVASFILSASCPYCSMVFIIAFFANIPVTSMLISSNHCIAYISRFIIIRPWVILCLISI